MGETSNQLDFCQADVAVGCGKTTDTDMSCFSLRSIHVCVVKNSVMTCSGAVRFIMHELHVVLVLSA